MLKPVIRKAAKLSVCGLYRHTLSRIWDASRPTACIVMCNPSTADANEDDPTIRKLIGFGLRLGWGGFVVVNLFSYRATKFPALRRAGLLGQARADDNYIVRAALRAQATGGPVVCAWGAHTRGMERPWSVEALLRQRDLRLLAFRLLADGTPEHPLMLPYSCKLITYRARRRKVLR